jgi:hypothetical protein
MSLLKKKGEETEKNRQQGKSKLYNKVEKPDVYSESKTEWGDFANQIDTQFS